MARRLLRQTVADLRQAGHLRDVEVEIDPHLEAPLIQRLTYQAEGPALHFVRAKNTQFPMVCNLFGTLERARFIFRETLQAVERLVDLKVDPTLFLRHPWRYLKAPLHALRMLPRTVAQRGGVLTHGTTMRALPQVQGWPDDGGPFITLPLVYTEDPVKPGCRSSNLGMYRIQMGGNAYEPDAQVGLHYQLHRGIGIHHTRALAQDKPLRVNIFVGGSPAAMLAAVMPLPEGMTELGFAGVLQGARLRMGRADAMQPAVYMDADFCIQGHVEPNKQLPEGPFGDHLGYYAKQHPFPVLQVERVTHRPGAIWPFTSVGRPPQEDTVFGELIHQLTGPIIPTVLPGVEEVHAVDAAGVHPLLLAVGSERYQPYQQQAEPQELLTQANAILGQGQMSLAKYLFIAAKQDAPPPVRDIAAFLQHVLRRADWRRDLHFQTRTTIDTLDYSSGELNRGSKLVVAAAGQASWTLQKELGSFSLPPGYHRPTLVLPGIVALVGPTHDQVMSLGDFCDELTLEHPLSAFRWIVVCDDSDFTARSLSNFLWVTFTRSNPAVDTYGIASFAEHKHWGCRGALVTDARSKQHHAPALEDDPRVLERVKSLAVRGGPLEGLF